MKVVVKKTCEASNSDAGVIYVGEKKFKLNNKFYKIKIKGIQNPSKNKASFYIDTIKNIQKDKFISINKNKKIWQTCWRILLKCLYLLDFEMKKWKSENVSSNKSNFFILPEKIIVDDNEKFTIIPNQLNNEEINKILKIKEHREKIYFSTNLIILKEFVNLWEGKINENAKEYEFREIFFKQKILINLIFGYSIENDPKKENELKEEKTNKTDLEGKNWILEFKKPNTTLFSKNFYRNNIYGITKELASSKTQLELLIKKKNRESDLESSFNNGTLIIGHIDQFKNAIGENDKYKILTWEFFQQGSNVRILLFSDVLKIAQNLIKIFESKKN